ncbi:HrpB1 family type III secretion system apparatus protein [Trinickia acidisoli]|uniref:HrpB1 family type III secretion system apparatus protein n=1 Tax=Trinickia acidisoli TaxID=2767482 RepID=UPI001A8F2D51|nr:HrpB1 family type III secretion system apparatus protein [Trinickia acidisoli]
MYANNQEYLNCSADVVGGLIETVCAALMDNFPDTVVDSNDAGMVLDALHVLRPDSPELDALDGIHCIVKGCYDDAVRILRQVSETSPGFAYARALLAFSLAAKGDPEWQQRAGEVMANHESRDAQQLVRVLIARHDLMEAQRATRLGAQFVVPDSVKALMDEPAAPIAPHEPTTAVDHQMGFLRA